MLSILLLSLHLPHQVDLRPLPADHRPLDMAKPQYSKKPKNEDSKLGVSVKSSIPEQIIGQQAGKIDPKPYNADSTLPDMGEVLKNSTNGVDLKVRF